jgi:N-carbamoylputrescine amidase
MRVTVCELPHEPKELEAAWRALCAHTSREGSELVLLPELAMVEPIWESERFDLERCRAAEALGASWLLRLRELRATYVVGTRPITIDGAVTPSAGEGSAPAVKLFNEGFLAFADGRVSPLRRKCYLPDETGNWEAHWFERGDALFPPFRAGAMSFGLNICTELWALDSYAEYARRGVHAILAPRATASATTAKWMAVGAVAAVRAGAFSLSSNRVDPTGACGGVGWIISPDGEVLATTSSDAPFATVDIDLTVSTSARSTYPRSVFD